MSQRTSTSGGQIQFLVYLIFLLYLYKDYFDIHFFETIILMYLSIGISCTSILIQFASSKKKNSYKEKWDEKRGIINVICFQTKKKMKLKTFNDYL